MSVEQQLRQRHLERIIPNAVRKPITHLTPEQQAHIEDGMKMLDIAAEFLEVSGIKLALFEFNQDLLDNKGRISEDRGAHYTGNAEGESLTYHSSLTLKWQSPEEKFYALTIGVDGDLLDTLEIDGLGEDHAKNLSITLFQSGNPTDPGEQVGSTIVFGRYFDIYEPSAIDSVNTLESITNEKDAVNYVALEEKEDAEDIGKHTFKSWVEANIAGFVAYLQREQHQDPLCLPLLDN